MIDEPRRAVLPPRPRRRNRACASFVSPRSGSRPAGTRPGSRPRARCSSPRAPSSSWRDAANPEDDTQRFARGAVASYVADQSAYDAEASTAGNPRPWFVQRQARVVICAVRRVEGLRLVQVSPSRLRRRDRDPPGVPERGVRAPSVGETGAFAYPRLQEPARPARYRSRARDILGRWRSPPGSGCSATTGASGRGSWRVRTRRVAAHSRDRSSSPACCSTTRRSGSPRPVARAPQRLQAGRPGRARAPLPRGARVRDQGGRAGHLVERDRRPRAPPVEPQGPRTVLAGSIHRRRRALWTGSDSARWRRRTGRWWTATRRAPRSPQRRSWPR